MTLDENDIASRLAADKRDAFVAFIDLLGFSERLQRDWGSAAAVYGAIMAEATRSYEAHKAKWDFMHASGERSTMQAVSDSIMIVGADLIEVGSLAQALQSAALSTGKMLVRGGIARGAHASVTYSPHSFLVSRPLARAAHLEASVAHFPRIILDRESGVEAEAARLQREGSGVFMECEDGLWMVQPFSFDLQLSPDVSSDRCAPAREILAPLAAEHKESAHSAKYDWMLSCVDRVASFMDEMAGHPSNPLNWPEHK